MPTKNECTCYREIGGRKHDPMNPQCPYFSGAALRVESHDDDEPVTARASTNGCTCGFGGFHDENNERCALNRSDELFTAISNVSPVAMPSLVVNLDFNELLRDTGESEAFRIVGMLKDLLA